MRKILLGFLLLFSFSLLCAQKADIWHVEPPSWWVGMENTELQIMLHGDDIALLTPIVEYPGVEMTRIERTPNANYLFLYLNIDEETVPGHLNILLKADDSFASGDISISYELLARKADSKLRQGFDPSDVIYLITPDRFANGDPLNDEFPEMIDKLNRKYPFGRHGGDIKGIIDKLNYIADMGFTAIWLNPVLENDMPDQSYHGYAATDFYKIDARYGSNLDYQTLSQKAKALGIKLIMDQIMNHCGSSHWWMRDLPDNDWINSMDKYHQTTHRRVVLNDPYVAQSDISKFTDGWFVKTMPDMNQKNPLLADYLIQNSIWWVEFADLGGIRHDTHPYAGKEFMADYSCRIMNEYPDFNIVGEDWSVNPAIIAKWQRGMNNPDQYVSCMPSMFDFPLQSALIQSLNEDESWDKGWVKVYEMLSNDFLYANPFNLVTFPDNHDMDRFFTQVKEDYDLYKMGIAYFVTMRGIPQFYYGTEILMTNSKPGNHGLIRGDFPGGWTGDKKNGFTSAGLSEIEKDAQEFMKILLNWRKQSKLVHEGKLMHYAPDGGVYVYFRYLENEAVMVAFNKGKKKVRINPSDYPEMNLSVSKGQNVITGKLMDFSDIILDPRSLLIIEFDK
ncbi:MAG: glycoside hydrolase family 13 protein [Bacteroidales bacterium]|nr:glycoside hydrolase family 13 protein [Bacteroidales bacterium]